MVTDLNEMKTCCDCRERKSVGEFYAYVYAGQKKFKPRCKKCHNEKWRPAGKPRLKDLRAITVKQCKKCGETKNFSAFYLGPNGRPKNARCKPCHSRYIQEERIIRTYGITQKQFDEMFARQSGVCAICGGAESGTRLSGRMCVDHNHQTGEIRGILCAPCNRGIGLLRDSSNVLLKAAEYLKKWDC